MIRWKKIEVNNYQSLKGVVIELGDFTVIKGPSDIGKSALVRAVTAVLTNDFSKNHIRSGANQGFIKISTDKGSVKMVRSRKESAQYEVEFLDGRDKQLHSKLGRGAPPREVSEILGIAEIPVDKDVAVLPNVQSQFGGQFPLNLGESTISKLLGRVSNLNIVFLSLRKLEAEEKEVRAEINAQEKVIAFKTQQITEFSDIDDNQKAVELLEVADSDAESLRGKIASGQSALLELKNLKNSIEVNSDLLGSIAAIEDVAVDVKHLAKSATQASICLEGCKGLADDLKSKEVIEEASQAIADTLTLISQQLLKIKEVQKLGYSLSTVREKHNQIRAELLGLAEEEKQVRAELEEMINSADLCPLIKGEWRKGCKEALVSVT